MQLFSPAQCAGYLAFVLGVTAFLQKDDRRLKLFVASECLVYTVHFTLLGNPAAAGSALVSAVRSFLARKSRSPVLAWLIIAINVALGALLSRGRASWIPVVAASAGTLAVFRLEGIPMRLLLLASTFLWLTNNILSGSIGGTLLESAIATVNTSTVIRLLLERAKAVPASDPAVAPATAPAPAQARR